MRHASRSRPPREWLRSRRGPWRGAVFADILERGTRRSAARGATLGLPQRRSKLCRHWESPLRRPSVRRHSQFPRAEHLRSHPWVRGVHRRHPDSRRRAPWPRATSRAAFEALRGCWTPADSNPTNEMLALYRFCRFSTPPSAPTASPDVPASPFTRSGPAYQSVHRFGTAPRPAGPSLRPVSPPLLVRDNRPLNTRAIEPADD